MAVKDRHNGNILIDDVGHILHIDFGFMLGTSPGGVNFESAPFKLTQEYVELMKGKDSDYFGYFRTLMIRGLLELKKFASDFQYLLIIMSEGSDLPCFQNFDIKDWKSKFMEGTTDKEVANNIIIFSASIKLTN
jgi:phosphatidylinositol 4-kinase